MKEVKKITIFFFIILIFVFVSLIYNFIEFDKEKNVNSLLPRFNNLNIFFWSIICFLSSFPYIFCILTYKRINESDSYQ
jgi:hypothetical protein